MDARGPDAIFTGDVVERRPEVDDEVIGLDGLVDARRISGLANSGRGEHEAHHDEPADHARPLMSGVEIPNM